MKFLERVKQELEKPLLGLGTERLAALAIDANLLLVPRDDPRFHRGDAFRIGDDAFSSDVRAVKAFLQCSPGLVIAGDAEHFHACAKRADVAGPVPPPAQAPALLNEIHA